MLGQEFEQVLQYAVSLCDTLYSESPNEVQMSKVFSASPDATITLRLPAGEKEKLIEAARAEKRNLTGFIRVYGLRAAEKVLAAEQQIAA
jgi:hypothetical protein